MKRTIHLAVLAIVVLLLIGGAAWSRHRPTVADAPFNTVPVKRGDLVVTIDATGTVEPEEVVDVGAQVAGRIAAFGTDEKGRPIDYGSVVAAGQTLAKIEDSLYVSEMALAAAQLQQAHAQTASAEATLAQLKAKLEQARRDWARAEKIGSSEALAQSVYDGYKAAYDGAVAGVGAGEAGILQARALVAQAEAAVARAQLSLGYCVIQSPVKGVIIDRRVNIGQTVVSSLNAPSLFLIAKDLTRMQVWVSVNEADIGAIKPGQAVTFTVDAYPGEVFKGEVGKVRLNATMTQNVVTYTVEVLTDNSNEKLLPYLTADVQFTVERRDQVLMVPNAALRWSPPPERIAPGVRSVPAAPKPGVWVADGHDVRPIRVQSGVTDGSMTEVTGSNVVEGLPVIVSEAVLVKDGDRPAATANPFIPKLLGGRR